MTIFQLEKVSFDVKIGILISFHIIDVVYQLIPRSSHIQQMIYTGNPKYILCSTVFCVGCMQLKTLREQREMTQKDLALRESVKIDILHDYENGRETPDGRIDPKKNTIR
jgi:DNA-binding XRE family transcriptional regulator